MSAKRDGNRLVVTDEFHLNPKQIEFRNAGHAPGVKEALFHGAIGSGKQLCLNTPIPTPQGWTTMGKLGLGDVLFDEQGQPCRVTALYPVDPEPESYRLIFSDGETIDACAEHQWLTFSFRERVARTRRTPQFRARRRAKRPSEGRGLQRARKTRRYATLEAPTGTIRTTREIANTMIDQGQVNHAIPVAAALDLPEAELPIDPYVLGVWLGDGTASDGSITTEDAMIVEEIRACGYEVRFQPSTGNGYGVLGLASQLRSIGLLRNKHIPPEYLRGAISQRQALLEGLMDTDGTASGYVSFSTVSKRLAEQMAELVRSLGGKPTVRRKRGRYLGREHLSWRVNWTPIGPVFRLPRKLARQTVAVSGSTARWRYIVSCERIEPVPMRCITVDSPSSLYLAGRGMIPTHNTQIACRMIVGWAWRYGGTYVVSRLSYRELEDSTKKAMLVGDGGMPPALPPELIKKTYAHGSLNKVILKNGAEILFRSLEPAERGKVRNITAAGWFIDQAEELEKETDEELYDEIMGRLRDPNGPRRMLLVANPGVEDHWLARRFGVLNEWRNERQPQTIHVHVSLLDNASHLPADYVRSLLRTKETRPDFYKRMVLGLWGSFGGRRFKVYDPALHLMDPIDVEDGWEVVAGLDWGYKNPFCYLSVVIDYEGRWYVVAEHYASEKRISEHAIAIKAIEDNKNGHLGFQGKLSPTARWLDPTAFNRLRDETESHATSLAENGIYCGRAQNDRLAGWNRLDEFLAERMEDGFPRLRIFKGACPNLERELPQLRIKPGTDDVEKSNDHSPDALRYIISSRMPTPTEQIQTPEEAHTREELVKRIVERSKREPELERIGI